MQRSAVCPYCHENYALKDNKPIGSHIPLMLPCGDTFCEGCLVKLARKSPQIECIQCMAVHTLNPGGEIGVKNLVPDIYNLGLLLYNKRLSSENEGTQLRSGGAISKFNGVGEVVRRMNESFKEKENDSSSDKKDKEFTPCGECMKQPATCQCNSCGDNCKLCENCFKRIHQEYKMLSKHRPLPLQDLSELELTCSVHDSRNLEFYDNDLEKAICALCVISCDHQGHKIVPLTDVDIPENTNLMESVENSKDVLFHLNKSYTELKSNLPGNLTAASDLFHDIHDMFNVAHSTLLKRQMDVIEEATSLLFHEDSLSVEIGNLKERIENLTNALSEYKMIEKDERILKLKSTEFLERFKTFENEPCVLKEGFKAKKLDVHFYMDEEPLKTFGQLKNMDDSKSQYELVRTNEVEDLEVDDSTNKDDVDCEVADTEQVISTELVCVTHVRGPCNFHVQLCADKERLQCMMSAINAYCRQAHKTTAVLQTVSTDDMVCAQFMDNNWYRARVIDTSSPNHPNQTPTWQNGIPVHVLYIDYGNTEWLGLDRMRKIKSEFLENPEIAIPCSLVNITPNNQGKVWSKHSIKAFNSLVSDKHLLMTTIERRREKHLVELTRHDTSQNTVDVDMPSSIRQSLIFISLATPTTLIDQETHENTRTYKEACSLEANEFVDVTVTHVIDPQTICVQRLDSPVLDLQDDLCKLYKELNNVNPWKVDWPYKGLVCGGKFSEDGSWYRAVVKEVNIDESCLVEYVDYGNSETLPFDNIKKIPDMFLMLPKQAVKVHLHNTKVIEESKNHKAQHEIEELLINKQFVAHVSEVKGSETFVKVFDTSTNQDVDMNDLFVKKGLLASTDGRVFTPEKKAGPNVPRYPATIFPRNTRFEGTCLFVDEHAHVHIHPRNKTGKEDALLHLMNELNSSSTRYKFAGCCAATDLAVGQASVTRYTDDMKLYRTTVEEVVTHNKVKVHYIDFGNSEITDSIHVSKAPWCIIVPPQCIAVQLAHLQPVFKRQTNGYSKECVDYLSQNLIGFMVRVNVVNSSFQTPQALLECESVGSVNDDLIRRGFATKREEELLINFEEVKSDSKIERAKETVKNEDLLMDLNFHVSKEKSAVEETNIATEEKEATILEYKRPRLPDVGVLFDVTVTQIDSPELVYIQRLPPSAESPLFTNDSLDRTSEDSYTQIYELEVVQETINETGYFDDKPTLENPKVGVPCLAQYREDKTFYRARIQSIKDIGAEVVYVDYGTSESLQLSELKVIPPELMQLPTQATLSRLCGLKPSDGSWKLDVLKSFYSLVANKRLIAQITEKSDDGHVSIHLYDRCLDESSSDGGTKDTLVGQVMADEHQQLFNLDPHQRQLAQLT